MGVAAYQRGDYAGARESFALAYELDPTYRNAAVLGQTEEKLGQLPQAATLLHWSFNRLDAHVAPESKARIAADLTLLQGRVLTLDIVTPVAFDEVLIDDLLFSANSLRVLSNGHNIWRIYLEPTEHQVTVRATGYHPQQRKVGGTPGTSIDWELRWEVVHDDSTVRRSEQPATDATVSPLVVVDHPKPSGWQLPVAITTGSLALLAGGFGLYSLHRYGVASDNLENTSRSLRATNLDSPCGPQAPQSNRPACNSLVTAHRDQITHGNRAITALSAAGALAITSTAFWVWWWSDRDEANTPTAWNFAPFVGVGESGAVIQHSF